MKLENKSILITGGSSGIGLELAKRLSQNNRIVICGRSVERLSKAKEAIPRITTICCDISSEKDRSHLLDELNKVLPDWDVLINNAAIVHKTDFDQDTDIVQKAISEVNTNFVAPVALTKAFLARRERMKRVSVINITTGLIYAPRAAYPVYCATKSALHSFSQVLRMQLAHTDVNVIEIILPVVNTPWHKGEVPSIAIQPEDAVTEMLREIERGGSEIKVGKVKLLFLIGRIAPSLALRMINRVR